MGFIWEKYHTHFQEKCTYLNRIDEEEKAPTFLLKMEILGLKNIVKVFIFGRRQQFFNLFTI